MKVEKVKPRRMMTTETRTYYQIFNENGLKPTLMMSVHSGYVGTYWEFVKKMGWTIRDMEGRKIEEAANGHGYSVADKLRKAGKI
jgi:hypothetical protein